MKAAAAAGAVASVGKISRSATSISGQYFTPEQFGAQGDGITNDTAAFVKLASALSTQGGGTVVLRPTTYVVGQQRRDHAQKSGFAFDPSSILEFKDLAGGVTIAGNGATIRCASGLRYGTFDSLGNPTSNRMPYLDRRELATPYIAMIFIENCAGPIQIRDLELDGNSTALRMGGQFGDVGWQIPASGIFLRDNSGSERVKNVRSHHHALDGMQIDGIDQARADGSSSEFENVLCEYNGRQGVSLVGGRGYSFRNCAFNHTGRGPLVSAPAAGFDIEAEGGKKIREVKFETCEFANNVGAGLVADSGDTVGADFRSCRFIGTSNWAVWPNKPSFKFQACVFTGSSCNFFGSADPALAAQLRDCLFTDAPTKFNKGRVYGDLPALPIADLSSSENVLFDHCRFRLTRGSVLPWSVKAIFADCVMSQVSAKESYPRGTYIGRNSLTGRATVSGSKIVGDLILNGKLQRTGNQS